MKKNIFTKEFEDQNPASRKLLKNADEAFQLMMKSLIKKIDEEIRNRK